MNKTRFTPWVVLVCMSALAACTSGEGGTAGNTELNVVVPNNESSPGVPAPIDIQSVEYTINCLGNDDVFLDNDDSFVDAVVLNGNLEIVDGRTDPQTPPPLVPPEFGTPRPGDGAEVWQAFMDLPPGLCTIQLRARDNDNEVICTATESFEIFADVTSKVNLVLVCDVSFQAPVGMLDVDATFSFVVGNFCPDLFIFNAIDTDPQEQIVNTLLGPISLAFTSAEVRFRDGDNTCGAGCDPQVCDIVPEGLDCYPACDPPGGPNTCPTAPTTTITCTSNPGAGENETAILDCNGDFIPDPACTITGNTLGVLLPTPPGGLCAIAGTPCNVDAECPDPGDFCLVNPLLNSSALVGCVPPTGIPPILPPGSPGATITCTAVTTDGDVDCDKTKQFTITCPGLTPCQDFDVATGGLGTQAGADAACDAADGTVCIASACDNATCDGATAAACCSGAPVPDGTDCSAENPPLASCTGGVCLSDSCTSDADCDDPATECLVAPVGACDLGTGLCAPEVPGNDGAACDSGVGSGDGTCGGGLCNSNDACQVDAECPDPDPANDCVSALCNTAVTPYVCGSQNEPSGTACDAGGGNIGACDGAGNCDFVFDPAPVTTTFDLGCNAAANDFGLPVERTVDPGPEIQGAGATTVCFSANIPITEDFILAAEAALGNDFISAEISPALIPSPLVVPAASFAETGTSTTSGVGTVVAVSPGPDLTQSCGPLPAGYPYTLAPAGPICPPDGNGFFLDLENFPPSGLLLVPFPEVCGTTTIPPSGGEYCFNLQGDAIQPASETQVGLLARTPSPFVILPANFVCGPADPQGLGVDCDLALPACPLAQTCEQDAICFADADCAFGTCDLTPGSPTENLCNDAGTCTVTIVPDPDYGETCFTVF